MSTSPFRFEGSSLFYKDTSFTLKLADFIADYDASEHNCCKIPVDLSSDVSLDFSLAESSAKKIIEQGGYILWDFHIDYPSKISQMRFEGLFNLHYYSLKVFSETLFEKYKDQTIGCCLFEGTAEIDRLFSWSEGDMVDFQDWLEDLYQTPEKLFETKDNALGDIKTFFDISSHMLEVTPFSRHLRNIYTMNLFMSYLHRLVAALPEDLIACVSLDAASIDHEGFLTQLLSKERFSHIYLLLDKKRVEVEGVMNSSDQRDARVGVCFPNDPQCLLSHLNLFKKLFIKLNKNNISYKIIPEFLMTSSGDGLDDMIFSKRCLSPQGKRMLQGFVAAGGTGVYMDEPIGLENEANLEKIFVETR